MRWWQRGVREHPRIDVTVKPALERLRVNEWLTWGYLMLPYLSARLNNRLALRAGVNDGAGIRFQRAEINHAAPQPPCVCLGGKKMNCYTWTLLTCGHGFFLILQTLVGPSWPHGATFWKHFCSFSANLIILTPVREKPSSVYLWHMKVVSKLLLTLTSLELCFLSFDALYHRASRFVTVDAWSTHHCSL